MNKDKKWITLRTALLTAAAVMLIMSAGMGKAWAYFSTYARATGGIPLRLGHEEHVHEYFSNWMKEVKITSTEDSRPVYVRARAYCADYDVIHEGEHKGKPFKSENWEPSGDWMYYTEILPPGESTSVLYASIVDVPEGDTPGVRDADSFNVIIVYETTEVQYDQNGVEIPAMQADWNGKIKTGRTGGGN